MMKKVLAGTALALVTGAFLAPAKADVANQTIDATLGSSVALTAAPSDVSSWALAASGANTTSGGNLTVSANTAYTVSVVAEKATLSEWNGTGYVSNGKSLTAPMTVSATRTGGTAAVAGLATPASVGVASAGLITGTGGGTDAFSVSLSQPTLITDKPLTGTNTYHNKLTYTASAAL